MIFGKYGIYHMLHLKITRDSPRCCTEDAMRWDGKRWSGAMQREKGKTHALCSGRAEMEAMDDGRTCEDNAKETMGTSIEITRNRLYVVG